MMMVASYKLTSTDIKPDDYATNNKPHDNNFKSVVTSRFHLPKILQGSYKKPNDIIKRIVNYLFSLIFASMPVFSWTTAKFVKQKFVSSNFKQNIFKKLVISLFMLLAST